MFSTMKYKGLDELTHVNNATASSYQGQGRGHGYRHLACKKCRAGKLRCNGQKGGCDRCLEKNLKCVYLETSRPKQKGPRRPDQGSKSPPEHSPVVNDTTSAEETVHRTEPSTEEIQPPSFQENVAPQVPSMLKSSELPMVDDMMDGLSQDSQRQGYDPQSSFLEFPISILDDTNMSTTDNVLSFTPMDEEFPLIDQSDTNPETSRESVLGDDSLDYLDDFSALLASPMTIPSPFTSSINQVPNGRGRQFQTISLQDGELSTATLNSPFPEASSPASPSQSPRSRPVSSTNTSTSVSCKCLQAATSILECVEIKLSRIEYLAADNLLSFQKRTLRDCHAILDCPHSSANSALILLLLLISDKLVASFRRSSSIKGEQWQNMNLGEYKVNLAEERSCVLKALVALQLGRMKSLLKRLWSVVCSENWETHRNMLRMTCRQFQEFWGTLDVTQGRS